MHKYTVVSNLVSKYLTQSYEILCKRFSINPIVEIIYCSIDKFPSNKDVPACTTFDDKVDHYIIYVNYTVLYNKFFEFTKLICIHEMCHVFTDELTYKYKLSQSKDDHAGHPRLFFRLMGLFKLNTSELNIQNKRHEIPYNDGMPLEFTRELHMNLNQILGRAFNLNSYVKEYDNKKIFTVENLCQFLHCNNSDRTWLKDLFSRMPLGSRELMRNEVLECTLYPGEDGDTKRIRSGAKFIMEVLNAERF